LKQAGRQTDGSPTEAKASGKGSPTDAHSQRDGSPMDGGSKAAGSGQHATAMERKNGARHWKWGCKAFASLSLSAGAKGARCWQKSRQDGGSHGTGTAFTAHGKGTDGAWGVHSRLMGTTFTAHGDGNHGGRERHSRLTEMMLTEHSNGTNRAKRTTERSTGTAFAAYGDGIHYTWESR
jgi:hypothetical protein